MKIFSIMNKNLIEISFFISQILIIIFCRFINSIDLIGARTPPIDLKITQSQDFLNALGTIFLLLWISGFFYAVILKLSKRKEINFWQGLVNILIITSGSWIVASLDDINVNIIQGMGPALLILSTILSGLTYIVGYLLIKLISKFICKSKTLL